MAFLAKKHGHRWICPRSNIVSQDLVNRSHADEILVYAYHVNDYQIAKELIMWGVDAIGTDFPDLISNLVPSMDKH